jgi:hypothetical protein
MPVVKHPGVGFAEALSCPDVCIFFVRTAELSVEMELGGLGLFN